MNPKIKKERIKELVDKYNEVKSSGNLKNYSEEDTKKGFIEPLFEILGWDIRDKNEVSTEDHIKSVGRVDYSFSINGRVKFYLEAKSLRTDLHRPELANQAIRYSWNKGANWAILTDFESLKVFYCQDINKSLSAKLLFEIKYGEYLDRFDQLQYLSKEAFETDSINLYAENIGKKLQRISVDEKLYKDLNECRKLLINVLGQWNKSVNKELLEEGVQKLLDRLVFLRVAEDRKIEDDILIPLIRQWENSEEKKHLFEFLIEKFRELDEIYNSNLFSPHPFEKWKEYSGVTEKVIKILKGKPGYYEYDFKAMPADVLGAVYENYLGHKLAESQKGLILDKSAKKRKEQGIYYTPEFIVDYIVKNTLKPVLDKCKTVSDLKKIKVLDPACGSGSFLIKALDVINEKYKEFGSKGDEYTKITILLENIYGVDLDEQAVEIARLNLLLNALETKMKLPKLDKNIKNGNSLISGTDEELQKYFGKNFKDKKSFNWQEEFPEVFKQGGFDVIIGNPPYGAELDESDKKYFYDQTRLSEYQLDTYILFIEKAFGLLKEEGLLGFIIPNTWLTNIKVKKLRSFLANSTTVEKIVNYSSKVFPAATVDSITLIAKKNIPKDKHNIAISLVSPSEVKNFSIPQNDWRDIPIFNIFLNDNSRELLNKIEKDTKPLSNSCVVTVGMKPYQEGKGQPPQTKDIVEQRTYDSDKKLNDNYRQYLRGRDINRYHLTLNPYQWISYGKWLAEPRKEELFNANEKIVIRQTGDSLIATIDRNKLLCLNNLHTINKETSDINLKFILGLLNSKVLNFYFQYLNPEKGEALAEVKATNVKRLPIKIIQGNNKKVYDQIIKYVERILDLDKQLQDIPENSNKWEEIKTEIGRVNKKIDEEVYKLYGLTPEEIAIVEGDSKN